MNYAFSLQKLEVRQQLNQAPQILGLTAFLFVTRL